MAHIRGRGLWNLFPLLIAGGVSVAASPAVAAESFNRYRNVPVSIEAQLVRQSLTQLGLQTGLQIVFRSDIADGILAPAITGITSVVDALDRLLEGGSLSYRFINQRTVVIYKDEEKELRKNKSLQSVSLMAASALTLSAAGPSVAQVAAQPSQVNLEEVIVTAQRREEGLQRTPVAVTALSEEQLLERGIDTTQDLQQNTPNLQVASATAGQGTSSATFFIRGLGQQREGNGTQPAVGVYVDDFYYPTLSGNLFRILDVQSLEVLRGPQGTLFGRNTIGGAVRYITKRPSSEFEGYVDVTGGSREHFDAVGMVNVPVTDNFSLRASGGKLSQDGFVRRATDGGEDGATESTVGRLQARYEPTDGLTIDLTAAYIEDQLEGFPVYISAVSGTAPYSSAWNQLNPGNPYDARYTSVCFYCNPGNNNNPYAKSIYNAYQATVTWDVAPSLTIKSLTGQNNVRTHSRNDWDYSPLSITNQTRRGRVEAFSQELQFNGVGFGDRMNWVGGLYYFHSDEDSQILSTGVPPATNSVFNVGETTSYAAYVQASYELTDKLALTGGIRYSQEERSFVSVTMRNGRNSDSATWNNTSPLLKLQYQWTDTFMTYLSASRGFRGGGFTNLPTGVIIPFDPETIWSYEAGARIEFLDRRLRVNPTIFYTSYDNMQLEATFPIGQTFSLRIQNAAKSRIYGSELEFQALISRAFEIHGYVSTLNTAYREIGNASGITLADEFERSPHLSYGIGGKYDFQLNSGNSISVGLDWAWTDEQRSSPNNNDTQYLPAYGLLNGRIQYNSPGGSWYLAAYGRNIMDKEHFVGGTDFRQFAGPSYFDLGQPREIGINVRFNF